MTPTKRNGKPSVKLHAHDERVLNGASLLLKQIAIADPEGKITLNEAATAIDAAVAKYTEKATPKAKTLLDGK